VSWLGPDGISRNEWHDVFNNASTVGAVNVTFTTAAALNTSAGQFQVYYADVVVCGQDAGAANIILLRRAVKVVNNNGTPAIAAADTIGTDVVSGPLAAFAVGFSVVGGSLVVTLTGVAAHTIKWGCSVILRGLVL
jgi:hypothetical protein